MQQQQQRKKRKEENIQGNPKDKKGNQRDKKQEDEQQWAWDEDVVEFVEGKCCWREVLDREMDGSIDRFGYMEGEEVYDIYQAQQIVRDINELVESNACSIEEEEDIAKAAVEADYERSQRIRRQAETERTLQVMDETRKRDEFEEMLAKWADCCAAYKGAEEKADHRMEECA